MNHSFLSETAVNKPVGRIAPTPSGFLHIGNVFNFLYAWLLVRKQSGRLILRIDDLDTQRIKVEYIEDVFRVLDWLGLDWDEGPQRVDEVSMYSQQRRLSLYETLLERLWMMKHVFVCTCSRSQLAAFNQYPGICKDKQLLKSAGAWRLINRTEPVVFYDELVGKLLEVDLKTEMSYGVVRKRDGYPAYQIASLADDVEMGVNLIVRGMDLLPSTALQLHLAEVLGLEAFKNIRFYHHGLITDSSGEKMSKSAGAASMKSFSQLHQQHDLYRLFAQWVGLPHHNDIITLQDLLSAFKPGR